MNEIEIKEREELVNKLVEEIISNTPNCTEEERDIECFIELGNESGFGYDREVFVCSDKQLIYMARTRIRDINNEHNLKIGCKEFLELLETNPTIPIIIEEFKKIDELEKELQSGDYFIECEAENTFEQIKNVLFVEYNLSDNDLL